jgi:hypothetical protein
VTKNEQLEIAMHRIADLEKENKSLRAASPANAQAPMPDAHIRDLWIEHVNTDPELHHWPEVLSFARDLLANGEKS